MRLKEGKYTPFIVAGGALILLAAVGAVTWLAFFRTPAISGTWTGQRMEGSVVENITYTFSPDKTYSMTGTSDNRGTVTGNTVEGVYTLDGDVLTLTPQEYIFDADGQTTRLGAGEIGQEDTVYTASIGEGGATLVLEDRETGAQTTLALQAEE